LHRPLLGLCGLSGLCGLCGLSGLGGRSDLALRHGLSHHGLLLCGWRPDLWLPLLLLLLLRVWL